jgi:hypothetical protein
MRAKIIRALSAIIKVLAAVIAATAYLNPQMLPAKYVLPALILIGCASASKDFLITFCDILDDGKRNNSFDVSKLPLIALLCCSLALMNCAGLTAFVASPLGQASLVTAEALGKQLAKATETRVLEQIITKATAQIAALKAVDNTNADLGKQIVKQSEIIGLQGVIDAAQNQYVGLTGSRFVVPKNPVANVNP